MGGGRRGEGKGLLNGRRSGPVSLNFCDNRDFPGPSVFVGPTFGPCLALVWPFVGPDSYQFARIRRFSGPCLALVWPFCKFGDEQTNLLFTPPPTTGTGRP